MPPEQPHNRNARERALFCAIGLSRSTCRRRRRSSAAFDLGLCAILQNRSDDYFAHVWRRGSVQLDAEADEGLVARPGSLAASRIS